VRVVRESKKKKRLKSHLTKDDAFLDQSAGAVARPGRLPRDLAGGEEQQRQFDLEEADGGCAAPVE
jgi:hypothetical protein